MRPLSSRTAVRFFAVAATCVLGGSLFAQARPTDRIRSTIDERSRVVRSGNRHPFASPGNDAGAVPDETRLERMILVLESDAEQQRMLEEFLAALQDPESPQYHQWLTPEQFGDRFGVSKADSDRVVAWLEQHGLEVESVSAGRREIIFSGTAEQVASAFQTKIHAYVVDGETHQGNTSDPAIPLALAPVVAGVVSLHDFHGKPLHYGARPLYTAGNSHYLAPADFATIYNVSGAYARGFDGTGQTIAVVGRTNINSEDVQSFRSLFGLPPGPPVVVLNGPDPGIVSSEEEMEAALDVEWAGAVARNATIQLVVSKSTNSTDGIALSAQYVVNHNLAPVVTVSFGNCESALGSTGNRFWRSIWEQAAAQGMSVLVASGDSGAAGCDAAAMPTAVYTAGINGICSSPFSTCVGGTQFADSTDESAFWSPANAEAYGSALRYIPEVVWNESGAVAGGTGLWASGGGPSSVYSKPSWQVGPGVPNDGRRGVPDLSLTSASHVGYLVRAGNQTYIAAGTSAATPAFAGITGLLVQKTGERQGNLNPNLYALANKQSAGGAAVFHDITSGNNTVPGVSGFDAAAGYDPATGLGSVDADTMTARWSDAATPLPAFQLSVEPAMVSVAAGSSVSVTVRVASNGGFHAPVLFSTGTLPIGLTASFSRATLAAPPDGSTMLRLSAATQMPAGAHSVTIVASGANITQTLSVPVTVAQPAGCTYSVSVGAVTRSSNGYTGSVGVTAAAGCPWTASSDAPWLAVTSGSAGSGNGQVTWLAALNTTKLSRSAVLTIAGYGINITEPASTCDAAAGPSPTPPRTWY